MKKLFYIAVALLVLVGCNKNENIIENAPEGTPFEKGQKVTLTVGTGVQQGPNRVAGVDNITNNRIDFTWEAGDQILVRVGEDLAVFTLSSEPGSAEGEFTGKMPADGSTFDIQYPTTTPDLSAQVYTEEKTIPADKMFFKATSCTLGTNNVLYALYAMVQINLYGTDKTVGKIVFKDITDFPATASYTLTCSGGVEIGAAEDAATPFYMVVPVGEYRFKVEVWDAAETPAKICSFTTSAAKTFEFGKCLNMPAKEVADPYLDRDYVDLGLPSGLKWATCNVGANNPEDYGYYYAWGEADSKVDFNWSNYFDTNDEGSTFAKYNNEGGLTTLELDDDAAAGTWDGGWRMPTKEEQDELREYCTWGWCDGEETKYNNTNVKGYLVTSKTHGYEDNSIFLPAAGYLNGSTSYNVGSDGYYWSSSLVNNDSGSAYCLYFNSSSPDWRSNFRHYGRSVRPVCD